MKKAEVGDRAKYNTMFRRYYGKPLRFSSIQATLTPTLLQSEQRFEVPFETKKIRPIGVPLLTPVGIQYLTSHSPQIKRFS